MPEIGLVTVNCPLTMTGVGELVVQTGERRFVVDCKLKPVGTAGQVKIMLKPESPIDSAGGLTWPNDRLKIVPLPLKPPEAASPYSVFPARIKCQLGFAPSLLVAESPEVAVKLYKVVNPVPFVLTP